MMEPADNATSQPKMVCANHPLKETLLRCNRCEKPICIQCAVLTPIGYRCKECVRGQQKTFDTAQWIDYPVAILIAGVLSFFGSLVASVLGFFTLFIAPGIGMLIAEAIRRAVSKRRSVLLFRLSAAAALIGSLPLLIPILLGAFLGGGFYSLIWQGLYTFMITSTVYYRLRGIQMR
jgi:hypothetical protein